MSMNATDMPDNESATPRATVDLPEPEPPAIPMMSGLTARGRPSPLSRHRAALRNGLPPLRAAD